MTIQHMDFPSGSDGIWGAGVGTDAPSSGIYAHWVGSTTNGAYTVSDPDPNVTSGVCLRIDGTTPNSYEDNLRYVLSASKTVVGQAARFYVTSLPTENTATPPFFTFSDSANNRMVQLRPLATGALRVQYDIDDTVETYDTPGICITSDSWYHIEMKCDWTNGDIEVRVEGVPKIDLTGQDIGTLAGCQIVAFGTLNNFATLMSPEAYYVKDWVVWDGDGTENNDFLGAVQVYDILPTSDVTLNWTPSTGSTGYDLIDDVPVNDTTYIMASDALPDISQFTLTDLPEDVTSVAGLKTFVRARKTDGGDGTIQTSIDSGGTLGNGTDRAITTAFTWWMDVFEVDPATATDWTRSGINGAEIVLDRTT